MKSSELGLSAMYRILKKAGAERVSDESADSPNSDDFIIFVLVFCEKT